MKKQAIRTSFARLALAVAILAMASCGNAEEFTLSPDDYKKLDTFEGVMLGKADALFAEGLAGGALKFRVAAPAYDSFALQFPKSVAVPYALLRKGRSLQMDKKRFEAIKVYNQVLDYYPNVLLYAGAALCYIGDCQFDNGNVKDAMKAWAEMAKDPDYRKHMLAAGALNHLADNLVAQEKWADAVFYYEQVCTDFRTSNPGAAGYAIAKLRFYHVRVKPDVAKLRALYDKIAGFTDRPGSPNDVDFANQVIASVNEHGGFNDGDKAQRAECIKYYAYWAKALEGKYPKWDDYQITIANYRLREEADVKKWYARLDKQYKDNWKLGDYDRTIKWMTMYLAHFPKLEEYFKKLPIDKMQQSQIVIVIKMFYGLGGEEANKMHALARSMISKVKLSDDLCEHLARFIWLKDPETTEMLFKAIQDQDRGKWVLLDYTMALGQTDKAITMCDYFVKVPRYAKQAYKVRVGLYRSKAMWNEAIGDYFMIDEPPGTLYAIADCYMGWGKPAMAITQLSEIETFFAAEAPEACLRIAGVYNAINERKLYIARLRSVLKKYRSSPQSSTAHQLLQQMRVDPGGGDDVQ